MREHPTLDGADRSLEPELDEIVERFVELARSGQRVTVEEFAAQHARYATQIRELFPALLALESCAREENFPSEIGGYTVESQIGRGGMGIVYRAVQTQLDRPVALKVLPESEFSDSSASVRFQQEARAVAKLQHEHIVPIYEVGSTETAQYYAMQFIEGVTLSQYIAHLKLKAAWPERGPRERLATETADRPPSEQLSEQDTPRPHTSEHWRTAATIGRDMARALAHAHERGIVHRDVKPSNILMDQSGKAWMTDFGLAKFTDGDLTQTGAILGTLRYMAPEQYRGNAGPRSDIYSLGATLYELLALEPTREGADPSDGPKRPASYPAKFPAALRKSIPRDLQTIVGRALRATPDDRYQTADELADDLELFLAGKPIVARRPTLRERLYWWHEENKLAALVSVACVSVLLAVLLGWTSLRGGTDSVVINGFTLFPYGNDREVAELIYSLGGHVHIVSSDGPGHPDDLSELPNGPFHIEEIWVADCDQLSAETIAEFARLPGLITLYLNHSNFDEAWVPLLLERQELISLQLNGCDITDEALPTIAKLQNLVYLGLSGTYVTDEGVSALSELKHLSEVNLMLNSSLTDECLDAFSGLIQLDLLDVRETQVTEEGAVRLQEQLRETWGGTKVRYGPVDGPIRRGDLPVF